MLKGKQRINVRKKGRQIELQSNRRLRSLEFSMETKPPEGNLMVTIFHPSDFTPASESAFAHALKIALVTKARLEIMHVAHSGEDVHWTDFPRVRETLEGWNLLPEGSRKEDRSEEHTSELQSLRHL